MLLNTLYNIWLNTLYMWLNNLYMCMHLFCPFVEEHFYCTHRYHHKCCSLLSHFTQGEFQYKAWTPQLLCGSKFVYTINTCYKYGGRFCNLKNLVGQWPIQWNIFYFQLLRTFSHLQCVHDSYFFTLIREGGESDPIPQNHGVAQYPQTFFYIINTHSLICTRSSQWYGRFPADRWEY